MKVHLIKKATIENYSSHHAGSRIALGLWQSVLKGADWNTSQDITIPFLMPTYWAMDRIGWCLMLAEIITG